MNDTMYYLSNSWCFQDDSWMNSGFKLASISACSMFAKQFQTSKKKRQHKMKLPMLPDKPLQSLEQVYHFCSQQPLNPGSFARTLRYLSLKSSVLQRALSECALTTINLVAKYSWQSLKMEMIYARISWLCRWSRSWIGFGLTMTLILQWLHTKSLQRTVSKVSWNSMLMQLH